MDVDESGLNGQCELLRQRHDVELRPVVADLSREDLLESLLPQIEGLEIGLLVNRAGTKAYGLIFAESLWAELKEYGIDVLGFMPTTTDTEMLWAQSPKTPQAMVMSVEETVKLALDSLGETPSIFAGTVNRVFHHVLRSVRGKWPMARDSHQGPAGQLRPLSRCLGFALRSRHAWAATSFGTAPHRLERVRGHP